MVQVLIFPETKHQTQKNKNKMLFRLPYIDDGTAIVDEMVRIHLICTCGLQYILAFGDKRYRSIWNALKFTSVMPAHKSIGKKNYNTIKKNDRKYEPLLRHFEYLKNLGEVQATQVVATLVDGMQGHANRDNSLDVTYLPISMGYRSCYKWYMASLGYVVQMTAMGAYIVTGEDGKEVDAGEYCSFPTYFNLLKHDFPNLKVSRPVEDICKDCYAFTNRHRYLTNHTMGRKDDDGNGDGNDSSNGERSSDGRSNEGSNDDGSNNFSDVGVRTMGNADLHCPEAASTKADKERELGLLQAAVHIKMARAQRALYQAKVADADVDATAGKEHLVRRYTFVVDYGQNMELPVYNKEQPGCTYYLSPMSIYNLGVVDHAHIYNDGQVSEHLHCHVYTEGIGKKGANNVASLIIKKLQKPNLLCKDSVGGELNIIFDICSGQNKNNTVLKLPAWLMAMGYFKEIHIIFLVVDHTKNATDHLFNLLKQDYRKQNLFTFDELVRTLDKSLSLTIHPTLDENFLDYSKLLDGLYRPLTGNIKTTHIFSCTDDGTQIVL